MNRLFLSLISLAACMTSCTSPEPLTDYVDPRIGTAHSRWFFFTPAAVPFGMAKLAPTTDGHLGNPGGWQAVGYDARHTSIEGFANFHEFQVGGVVIAPTVGALQTVPGPLDDPEAGYRSRFDKKDEVARPGYYSVLLKDYGVKAELTATERVGFHRYTFPASEEANLIFNIGTKMGESGPARDASVTFTEDGRIEGWVVTEPVYVDIYQKGAVVKMYFSAVVDAEPASWGAFCGEEVFAGERSRTGVGAGVYLRFDTRARRDVGVKIGLSYTSVENARLNMNTEQPGFDFDKVRTAASTMWNKDLSKVQVEGGTKDEKTIFYTGMYHLLIHPNILQDVNGEYPMMESLKVGHTTGNRYTVFSLWDTYRNVSTLMTLLYPERQLDIIRTMLDMYRENGWLPKWELYGRETFTMEGDPSIPYIVDAWMRGLRDFDEQTAYEAMRKGATTPGEFNLLRPDANDYFSKGYVPLREQYDNSVSHALEYYIADWNLANFAQALGKKEDAKLFRDRSLGYKHYYSKEFGTLRPILPDGTFYSPFDPKQGENFEPSPGFHEGNAWNYTFYVPHDIKGLAKLMGGDKKFVDHLQKVFDDGNYDPANEPDIAYPYLFSYFKGEAWRTQKLVRQLLKDCYHNAPNGVPGNEDTGTMSAWAIFSMMGFYPACPGDVNYVLTSPTFDKVTIQLDKKFYPKGELVIESKHSNPEAIYIKDVFAGDKKLKGYTISQEDLVNAGTLRYILEDTHK